MKIKYETYNLKNGLKVLNIKQGTKNAFFLELSIKTGSINDPENQNGLAHFLEHILMEKASPQIEKLGGEIFASVDDETSEFKAFFPSKKLDKAISIYKNIFFEFDFQNLNLPKTRKIIEEEISLSHDDPSEVLSVLAKTTRFEAKSPLGRQTIGSLKSIRNIEEKDLNFFYQTFYQPSNAILVTNGDEQKIKNNLNKIKNQKVAKNQIKTIYSGKKTVIINDKYKNSYNLMTFPSVSGNKPIKERLIANLIAFLLGGLESSRLYDLLRIKKGLVYEIDANTHLGGKWGVLAISWACKEKNNSVIQDEIISEINKLKKEGVSLKELKAAGKFLNMSDNKQFGNLEGLMQWLTGDLLFEEKIYLPTEIEKIRNSITQKEIQKIANQIFDFDKVNIVTIRPR